MPRHVAVIGAGIVGVATAVWLQRHGHRVTLIDREGPAAGASFGNGGVLASSAVVPVTVPGIWARAPRMLLDPRQPLFLRWGYLPRLAPWLLRYLSRANDADVRRIAAALTGLIGTSLDDHQALAQGTEAESLVVPSEYSYLYRDRAAYDADSYLWQIRRALGFHWDELEGTAARELDPALGPDVGFAVRLPGHGRISDPGAYVERLAAHVTAQGGQVLRAEVRDFTHEEGRLTGLRLRGRDGRRDTLSCDTAVLAAGAWSGHLAAKLGVSLPMESERGYHIDLWEPSQQLRAPVMVAAGKFVAVPMEGRLRLAGVVEYGGVQAGASRAPFALLRRNLARTFPDLRWREVTEWMGHRPVTADSLPLIGPAPGMHGVWLGLGHQHIGLTGGARTGQVLAQMISGQQVNLPLEPYAPHRFQRR
ncbi:MAG: FAD-binding oxidoreductase [Rhodobacteraceae bacterium]|nr:MAG: FAD-binding oxidoreductase [Paracoccaceae bacterium]